MSDKTALSLTLHATHADDREAISAALAAQGLETMAGEFLDDPTPGVRYTDPEVDISNGVEHRTLAEALATHTRHTAFELVHHPDLANVGCYAAYAPGHELYFTFADADGDPYVLTEHVTRGISEAPADMTAPAWLAAHGPALLGTEVQTALDKLRTASQPAPTA